jgi:HEAT repeat protein/S1-C subfamily serine protease
MPEPVDRADWEAGGTNPLVWVAVSVVLIVLFGGGGVAAWLVFAKNKPAAEAVPPPAAPVGNAVAPTPEPAPKPLSGEQVYRRLVRSTVFVLVIDQTDGEITFVGCGSGGLVHRDRRLVVTNYHVVGVRDRVHVFFAAHDPKGELITTPAHYVKHAKELRVWGTVVARDARLDLALLVLDRVPDASAPLALAAKPAATNSNVWSVGASGVDKDFSGALWRSCSGTVTNRYRGKFALENDQVVDAMFLQTQKPVNPGDSGGPTVNDRCELVGVVSSLHRQKNLVTHDIDVTEVRAFLTDYATGNGWTWDDAATGAAAGGEEGEDIGALIARLGDPAAEKRLDAATRLAALGVDARTAFPHLVARLDDLDDRVRRAAAAALPKLGPPLPQDLGCLDAAVRNGGANARLFALRYFAQPARKPPEALVPDIVVLLGDPSADLRKAAVRVLANYGPGCKPKAMQAVLERTADDDPTIAAEAERLFQTFTPLTDPDRDVLVSALNNEKAAVRHRALKALAADSPACRAKALEAVLLRTADEDAAVAAQAEKVVQSFGAFTEADRPALVRLLDSKDAGLRLRAVNALAPLAADGPAAVTWFKSRVDDASPAVRVEALTALTKWGPAAGDCRREIAARTLDSNPTVAAAATKALAKIDGPQSVPALEKVLRSDAAPAEVKDAATDAILSLDLTNAEAHVPVLAFLTTAKQGQTRAAALDKLAAFKKNARPALDAITVCLRDQDAGVRVSALNAVAAVGPEARDAIPDVARLLSVDEPEPVALAAVSALGNLGPKAVDSLARALAQKFPEAVLDRICDALGAFGKDAQPAVPAILDALSRHPGLGERAATAAAVVREQKAWAPDPVSRALTKVGGDELVKQLIKLTGWVARGGVKKTDFPPPVNFWAIVVLGAIDPTTLTDAGKKLVADRLDYLVTSDPDVACRAAAKNGLVLHPKRK